MGLFVWKKKEPEKKTLNQIHARRRVVRLRVAVGAMLFYYGVGVIIYHELENWSVIDCLYFGTVTLTTVGYGDLTPTTDVSKMLTIGFVMYGVALGGMALKFLGEYLFSKQESMQSGLLKELNRIMRFKTKRSSRSNRLIEEENGDESCCDSEGCKSCISKCWGGMLFIWKLLPFHFRMIIEQHLLLINALVPIVLLVLIYATMISQIETRGEAPLDFLGSVYFSVITLAGVGYGDISPETQTGRLIAFIFIPIGVAVVAYSIINFMVKSANERLINKILNSKNLDDLGMDLNSDGKVDESEFLQFVLIECGKCDRKFLQTIKKTFRELDFNRSGSLTMADLRVYQKAHMTSLKKLIFTRKDNAVKTTKPEGLDQETRNRQLAKTKVNKAQAKRSVVV